MRREIRYTDERKRESAFSITIGSREEEECGARAEELCVFCTRARALLTSVGGICMQLPEVFGKLEVICNDLPYPDYLMVGVVKCGVWKIGVFFFFLRSDLGLNQIEGVHLGVYYFM